MRHVKQESVALRWGRRGECLGETAAVPSLELDSHEPVGLGGCCLTCAKELLTSLKSNTLSEKLTGADMGVVVGRFVEGSWPSWLRLLAPNTALERGLARVGFSPQVFSSTPSMAVLNVRVLGGLELCRDGNWNIFSDVVRVNR